MEKEIEAKREPKDGRTMGERGKEEGGRGEEERENGRKLANNSEKCMKEVRDQTAHQFLVLHCMFF